MSNDTLFKQILNDINSGELIVLATNSITSEWDKVLIGVNDKFGNPKYKPSKHFYLDIRLTVISKQNKKIIDKGETNSTKNDQERIEELEKKIFELEQKFDDLYEDHCNHVRDYED